MYQVMASEYLVASIFFIFGILVLNFWLFNLLVAVITNSFSAIRAGTKKSAFGAAPYVSILSHLVDSFLFDLKARTCRRRTRGRLGRSDWTPRRSKWSQNLVVVHPPVLGVSSLRFPCRTSYCDR